MPYPSETYESLNLEPKPIRPHILACSTVIFGDDYYNGRKETINLSGFVQLNKWPMPGFNHTVDDKGRAELELELISAPEIGIKGFSYLLNDRIQVLSNPYLPNTGYVRQIVPGRNFPATFHIRRFGILETSSMRLAHRDVISIEGVVDSIPPFKKPLTGPYLGSPRGDGPGEVVPAPNVVRGIDLPEAWYPANDMNQPEGLTPSAFFAPSMGPCMSLLTDPSIIVQSSMEGDLTLELNGKTERINLFGDHSLAGGAEILLYGPDKHDEGAGVLAQLARVAMVGECEALGGQVMLRVPYARVSGGVLGDGVEDSLNSIRYPGELHIDAHFEITTPHGVLYADSPVHISGALKDIQPTGAELAMDGPDSPLVTLEGVNKGRITGLRWSMGKALVGREATLTAS